MNVGLILSLQDPCLGGSPEPGEAERNRVTPGAHPERRNAAGDDLSEGVQISRTTVEREAEGMWPACKMPAGADSDRPGDVGPREPEETVSSAFPLNSSILIPAGGRNSLPLPRGSGMSKHDPHGWPGSWTVAFEGHSQQCSPEAGTTSMWPSSPRHTTTAPAFPNPTRIPSRTSATRDFRADNLFKSTIPIMLA